MISFDGWIYYELLSFLDFQATCFKILPLQRPVNVGWMQDVQMLGSKDFYIQL